MSRRQVEGGETWRRLREWDRGQTASERLAAQVLQCAGYSAVDPSHPMGGPDGLKDLVCTRDGIVWICAVYFARGQRRFSEISSKFQLDLQGIAKNNAGGIAFVTNQELKLSERDKLRKLAGPAQLDLFHLERLSSILDAPRCYGIRLEYLDIEMNREEQLAFIADRDSLLEDLAKKLERIVLYMEEEGVLDGLSLEQIRESVPLSEIREFQDILGRVAGWPDIRSLVSPLGMRAHVRDLEVPLEELREFEVILNRIAGAKAHMLSGVPMVQPTHVSQLRVPVSELEEYECVLARILEKLGEASQLTQGLTHDQRVESVRRQEILEDS